MYKNLLSVLKKPALWERSEAAFWDDEHISKGMLEAHLDPNMDAASRKDETIDSSVSWLSSIISKGSSILDLGCGPGLYARRLSALGYSVTGIDYSRRSIDYAMETDSSTTYFCKNYLELSETEKYDAVLLIYCDYGALTLPERKTLLANVYRALKPGGLFILDVFTDKCSVKKQRTNAWSLSQDSGFWCDRPHAVIEGAYLYENDTVRAERYAVITSEGLTDYILWDTLYTKERLLSELAPSGLCFREAYDDVCGAPYTGEADTLCFVAYKP